MDKRKEETLKEVRKKIGLQLTDRRNFLNSLLNIENVTRSIEVKKEHIFQMDVQLKSGTIYEKDKFGNVMIKQQLAREITFSEFQLKQLKLNLDFAKEDLYYVLHTNEGAIDKAGGLVELKEKTIVHFELMREEYKKSMKVFKNVI